MRWAAIIVAAGRGSRFGRPKQLIELAGLPMVGWSIRTLAAVDGVEELVVATEPESLEPMREIVARFAPSFAWRVVPGGAARQDSVREALAAVSMHADAVLVHDGARPLIAASDVIAGMREVREGRAALLAARIVDTVKVVDPQTRRVDATLDRATLWAAQTPQFAMAADLRSAHERARRDAISATDDAALLERIGIDVVVISPEHANFKVTYPDDVARAEAILRAQPSPCHPELVEG